MGAKHSFGLTFIARHPDSRAPRGGSGQTIWVVDAHSGDGRRFIVRADEKLSAFIELEREVLTVTFYLESIQ
jgi:hypothetical protein